MSAPHDRGVAHPLSFSPAGGVTAAAAVTKIEQSLRLVLSTQHGERVMRPTFGANLQSLVFAPNNAATANLARHLVQEGITRAEPRVSVERVDVVPDRSNDSLEITIAYRLVGNGDERSLVFSFALEQPR